MNYANHIVVVVFFIIQIALLGFWAYWFLISLFGFGKPKKKKEFEPQSKFAILIPAHNEEKVIGQLVENLSHMDYPKELYDIIVIADNCTDNTATVSSEAGAHVIVHNSKPDEEKGKPYAIRYALDTLGDYENKYDAVCVFDADNLVTLNYLKEMNNALLSGDKLIQCYLDSKNPTDNWISLSYATSYYYMNRSWQLAKERLGLGNAIGGTGFCVKTSVLKEVGWTARSLTEDLEFQMQCLLKDIPAAWSHHARVFDEKPTGFKVSCIQRLRWARGHWDVAFKYTGQLLKKSIKERSVLSFDGAMYLLNPGKIVIGIAFGLITLIARFIESRWFHPIMPWWIWLALIVVQFGYISYAIIKDTNHPAKKIIGIIVLPIFNYVYVPLFVWAFLTRKNKTWVRTEHSRDVNFQDVNLQDVNSSS